MRQFTLSDEQSTLLIETIHDRITYIEFLLGEIEDGERAGDLYDEYLLEKYRLTDILHDKFDEYVCCEDIPTLEEKLYYGMEYSLRDELNADLLDFSDFID